MITIHMEEMENTWDKGSINMFERGLGEVASMWHPHRCHKGDMGAKETSHAKFNISLLDESDGSRNLGERKLGQMCKRCKRL